MSVLSTAGEDTDRTIQVVLTTLIEDTSGPFGGVKATVITTCEVNGLYVKGLTVNRFYYVPMFAMLAGNWENTFYEARVAWYATP